MKSWKDPNPLFSVSPGTHQRQNEIQLFPTFVGSLHALCENIPNIEVSVAKAYSETIFWRKDIRFLVASPSQTSL
jgi:hypothetical protein